MYTTMKMRKMRLLARPSRRFTVLALVLLCSGELRAQPRVVNNPLPDPAKPAFRVSAQPLYSLGGRNDRDLSTESWQVSDVGLLSNNNLVVSHQMGQRVSVYNPRGQVVASIGGRGQGPGEFTRINQLQILPGDSIILMDRLAGRTILFAPDFKFVRQVRGTRFAECCLSDGAFLVVQDQVAGSLDIGSYAQASPSKWLEGVPLRRWGITGGKENSNTPRTLFDAPGNDPTIFVAHSPPREDSPGLLIDGPFRRQAIVRTAGTEIIYGRGDGFEYRVYSRNGQLLRTVRNSTPVPALTEGQKARARASITQGRAPHVERALQEMAFPQTAPGYDRILVQPNGHVWLRGYRSTYQPAAETAHWWARFSAEGTLLGTLQLPSDANVVRFFNDRVVLSRVSADGFTRLEVYAVEAN